MEPDFDKLRRIAGDIEKAKRARTWDREMFDKALSEATAAAAGGLQLTEFVLNEYDPAWDAPATKETI